MTSEWAFSHLHSPNLLNNFTIWQRGHEAILARAMKCKIAVLSFAYACSQYVFGTDDGGGAIDVVALTLLPAGKPTLC